MLFKNLHAKCWNDVYLNGGIAKFVMKKNQQTANIRFGNMAERRIYSHLFVRYQLRFQRTNNYLTLVLSINF